MANNPYVNKVQLADGTTLIDISDTTAVASDVAQGKYFYTLAGQKVQGTATGGSEDGSVYQDANGYIVLSDEQGTHVEVDALSVTQNGTYTASTGHAYSPVTVNVSSGISIDDIATNTQPSGAITLGSSVTSIGNYALAGKPITSITAPNVTSVAQFALQSTNITSITDANFPVLGVNSMYTVLLRISTLTTIKLSGEKIVLSSGSGAIRDNANLVSAEFPNCAKNVGASYRGMGSACFYGDTKLEFVDIGFCQSIATNAFYNCANLRTLVMRRTDAVVTLPNWNTATMKGIYDNPASSTIYVPNALISTYQTATNWVSAYNAGVTFAKIEGSIYE